MKTMHVLPNLGCTINLPPALSGEDLHDLPPYAPTPSYAVDAYPACPENWMRAEHPNGAFFVGVKKGRGLWLDLNSCRDHPHHVAAIISIQGINPITDKPVGEPKMEKYTEGPAPQNYLATTGTPYGMFWLDGFRGADGEVRQYVLTDETIRGLAAQVMGDERSFSIGVAFFLSKTPKPKPTQADILRALNVASKPQKPQIFGHDFTRGLNSFGSGKGHLLVGQKLSFWDNEPRYANAFQDAQCISCDPIAQDIQRCEETPSEPSGPIEESTKLEIAGGALINQQIYPDPQGLDFWKEKPESILYINYAEESLVRKILSQGQIGSKREGALSGLRIGN